MEIFVGLVLLTGASLIIYFGIMIGYAFKGLNLLVEDYIERNKKC